MNVLEKILEEIKEAAFQEDAPIYLGDTEVDRYVQESVVKEIIRSHMDEMNDDWIPVEDGLPEDERMVLVTYMTKSGISSVDRARFDGKYWRGSGFMGRVIAWQPLPKPYKPKKATAAGMEHIVSRFTKVE